MAQVPGVCSVCGGLAKPAYSCMMCGAVVCMRCFDIDSGLCRVCSSGAERK
jgi:hypothetical protein